MQNRCSFKIEENIPFAKHLIRNNFDYNIMKNYRLGLKLAYFLKKKVDDSNN